jgi:hypothetical protein
MRDPTNAFVATAQDELYLYENFDSRFSIITALELALEKPDDPYRNLLGAIFEDAVLVACGLTPAQPWDRQQSQLWLASYGYDWIIPCRTICEELNISQDAMLRRVRPRFMKLPKDIKEPARHARRHGLRERGCAD